MPGDVGTPSTRLSFSHTNGTTIEAGMIRANTNVLGFFGATAIAKPTGVPVTPEAIHAALVSLGLIGA